MSDNKKALTRYQVYDKCLRNTGRKYRKDDLVKAVNSALEEEGLEGIGKTQFYADMKYMEFGPWSAPIDRFKEGRTVYFRYSDSNYSINNQPLSATEVEQLKSALLVLSRFKGMPQFEWINEIIPAIESKLGLVKTDQEVIAFDNNVDYEGLMNITPIFNAIVNKRVLKISYQDFRSPIPYDVLFHPHYLKQFNNRWFAFGLNPSTRIANWNIALDRIKNIEELKEEYQPSQINWKEYFDDFIGVTKRENEQPVEVRLKFTPNQAPYILTKPLHLTQKTVNDETGLEVSIKVIPNLELERLILGFGADVIVLAPESLKTKIASVIRDSLSRYN